MNFDLSIGEEFKLKNYGNVIRLVEKHLSVLMVAYIKKA